MGKAVKFSSHSNDRNRLVDQLGVLEENIMQLENMIDICSQQFIRAKAVFERGTGNDPSRMDSSSKKIVEFTAQIAEVNNRIEEVMEKLLEIDPEFKRQFKAQAAEAEAANSSITHKD